MNAAFAIQNAATTPASANGRLANTIAAAHTESNTIATASTTSTMPMPNTSQSPLALESSAQLTRRRPRCSPADRDRGHERLVRAVGEFLRAAEVVAHDAHVLLVFATDAAQAFALVDRARSPIRTGAPAGFGTSAHELVERAIAGAGP